MDAVRISQLEKGSAVDGVLLVKSSEVRTSSTGSRFLDITLMDSTGEMNGKGWDWGENPAPAPGEAVRMKGVVTEYMGKLQMRVDKIRPAQEDEIDWEQLVPCAPEPAGEMYAELMRVVKTIKDEDYARLTEYMMEKYFDQLMIWPAAVSYHHSERSGLLYHTLGMVRAALALLAIYPWLDRGLLLCGVILHDFNKMEELDANAQGIASQYTRDGLLLGHITRGVQRVAEAGAALELPEEKVLLIQHMILSHHNEPEFGSPRRPMFPEAEMLHHLDILDARMYDMHHALAGIKPGEFTDRIRSLENRRLYKKTESDDN